MGKDMWWITHSDVLGSTSVNGARSTRMRSIDSLVHLFFSFFVVLLCRVDLIS